MTPRMWRRTLIGCALALCFLVVISRPRQSPSKGLPQALRSLQHYRATNAPTANLRATVVPFDAVTNQTIKELIAATGRLQAASNPQASPPGRKLYTADQPLPRQVGSLQRLQAASGNTLQAYLRPESHVPVQLKGYPLAEPDPALVGQPNGDELMAKRFLQTNRDVLLLTQPDDELRLNHRETDKLGRTVLRFSQFYRGLEVWPGEIGVHSDAAGAINLVHTTTVPTPEGMDTTPRFTAEQATQRARASVPGGLSGTNTEPKLLIYAPLDQPAKLAWKLELSFGLAQHWQVVVDAQTGSNLKAVNMCMCANVAGSGVDLRGVNRPLNVDQQGSFYYMRSLSKPMFNPATGNGIIEVVDAANGTAPLYHVLSSSPNSWANEDAVSAAFSLSAVYDYYLERHGRDSFNGLGSNLFAVVRYGMNFANAFWNPVQKLMVFGDADRYPASLDVTGHEVTHGVISSIGSKPILDYVNQSGALNESFSDIFGEMTEARHNGGMPDWIIGSVLNQNIRNMTNPPAIPSGAEFPYPKRMSELIAPTDSRLNWFPDRDAGGVHINSSIVNRAYYLIASGLSGHLGIPDSEAIFYCCLTTKFLPQSQFIDARLGCIASAEELFGVGSRQALKVAEGFDAIELFASPVNVPQSSTNLPSVSAPDSTMWVYPDPSISGYSLARYEAALGDPGKGIRIATSARITRPSVSGGGALVAFVTTDNSLALLETTGGVPTLFGTGRVSTMTFSPLADRAAFVVLGNGQPTNQIIILDTVNRTSTTVDLVTPVLDGPPVKNITSAGAMSFSADGKSLAYTAQSRTVDPDGNSISAWTIYLLDLASSSIKPLIPPNSHFESLQPFFSRTSSRFLLFEVLYQSDSHVHVADLETGTIGYIANTLGKFARACFTGDDTAIVYAASDVTASSGASLYRLALSPDKLSASGNRALWRFDSPVGVTYRRGTYIATNGPPNIAFTGPADGSVFTSPANFTMTYNATDPDGSIAKVELYEGSRLLFTRTNAPFTSISASNFRAGFHRYHLRAYDDRGAASTSSPLRIGIRPPQPTGSLVETPSKRFEMALGTTNSGSYRVEFSTNLVDWNSLGSLESLSNAVFFSDTTLTNQNRRFYRAVKLP